MSYLKFTFLMPICLLLVACSTHKNTPISIVSFTNKTPEIFISCFVEQSAQEYKTERIPGGERLTIAPGIQDWYTIEISKKPTDTYTEIKLWDLVSMPHLSSQVITALNTCK